MDARPAPVAEVHEDVRDEIAATYEKEDQAEQDLMVAATVAFQPYWDHVDPWVDKGVDTFETTNLETQRIAWQTVPWEDLPAYHPEAIYGNLRALSETHLDRRFEPTVASARTPACSRIHDDAGSGEDAHGQIGLPFGEIAYGTLGECRSGGLESWDTVDTYRRWVEEGDVLHVGLFATASTPGLNGDHECSLLLPGEHLDMYSSRPCWKPATADRSGYARIVITDAFRTERTWDGVPNPAPRVTPRPYAILLHHTSEEPDPADGTGLGVASERTDATSRPSARTDDGDPDALERRHRNQDGSLAPSRSSRERLWIGLFATIGLASGLILYRRLSKDDVLAHDLRSRILDLVEDDPGIHPTELADELDVAHQTVRYHLRILEDADQIILQRDGSGVHCFRSGVHDAVDRWLQPLLSSEPKRALLRLVLAEAGMNLSAAARRMDVHRSTVKRHADALEEAGVVQTDRREGSRVLEVPDEVRSLLAAQLDDGG